VPITAELMHAAEAASHSLGKTVTAIDLQKAADIEPAFTKFSREPGGDVIVGPNNADNHAEIIALAARLRLRYFVLPLTDAPSVPGQPPMKQSNVLSRPMCHAKKVC
jgi:hypothetical protein